MSVQLIAWAYEQRVGSGTRKAVLLALANRANHDTGLCCPSVERICEETEIGDRAVRQALSDLCMDGFIQRERLLRDGLRRNYSYSFLAGGATHRAAGGAAQNRQEVPLIRDNQKVNQKKGLRQPPNGRLRNPIWDALTEVFGDATTETARTRRGKVCRSLTAANATPDEILRRARSWPRHFDEATLTELALEKHWDALGRKPLRVTSR